MKVSAIRRSAVLTGFLLAVALVLGYQLRSTRAVFASTAEQLGDTSRRAAKAEIERKASIALLGTMRLEGQPLGDGSGGLRSMRWEPAAEGTSMVVFVTPSCPYSFELLQALVRHAEAGQGRTEILIASLAGDGRSLQTWIEHLQSDGASVTYMIQPRAAGRRIALDAVPMLFRYVDGTLVEVHAGRDWPPELENAEG